MNTKNCPQCNHPVPDDSNFCTNCGFEFPKISNTEIMCPKCQSIMPKNNRFCINCGCRLSENYNNTENNNYNIEHTNPITKQATYATPNYNSISNDKKRISKLSIIGFILSFLGCAAVIGLIISIIDIIKNRKDKNVILSIIAIFIAIIMILISFFVGATSDTSTTSNSTTSESSTVNTENESTDSKTESTESNSSLDMETANEDSPLNIAAKSIGMDPKGIKNIKDLDDWSSGTRYSFVYDGFRYIVFVLDNGEIDSINNETLTIKIYERGYEPLNYKDFEPDKTILSNLQEAVLTEVSKYINNESSLKTVSGSMIYSRLYNYYSINGEVKAKNNVSKETFSFSVDYLVDGNNYICKYVAIDGSNMFGNKDSVPEINKFEMKSDENTSKSSDSSFIISDGKEGEYGQYDDFDGEKYLRYYIPEGDYSVKCIIRGGFYIETIELHKEDGYDTATTISQYTMNSSDVEDITINPGECILLINNTELEFTKK